MPFQSPTDSVKALKENTSLRMEDDRVRTQRQALADCIRSNRSNLACMAPRCWRHGAATAGPLRAAVWKAAKIRSSFCSPRAASRQCKRILEHRTTICTGPPRRLPSRRDYRGARTPGVYAIGQLITYHGQWCGLRPSVLGQDRSETKKISLGLAGLVSCCETRSCHARRHNDLQGHINFSSNNTLFCAWNIATVAFIYLPYAVKSTKCLCLLTVVLVLVLLFLVLVL